MQECHNIIWGMPCTNLTGVTQKAVYSYQCSLPPKRGISAVFKLYTWHFPVAVGERCLAWSLRKTYMTSSACYSSAGTALLCLFKECQRNAGTSATRWIPFPFFKARKLDLEASLQKLLRAKQSRWGIASLVSGEKLQQTLSLYLKKRASYAEIFLFQMLLPLLLCLLRQLNHKLVMKSIFLLCQYHCLSYLCSSH